MSVIHALLAGAEFIDGCDVLRAGSTTCPPGANAASLGLSVIARNLSRWTVRIGGVDTIATAKAAARDDPAAIGDSRHDQPTGRNRKSFVTTETLCRCYLAIPARLARSARQLTLHLPVGWPYSDKFNTMLDSIRSVQLVT